MNLGSSTDLARVRDGQSCRQWLDKLDGGPFERLERMLALFTHLSRQPLPAEPTYEILEQARLTLLKEVEDALKPLQQMSLPLQPSQLAALEQIRKSMDMLHQLYRRSYTRMIEAEAIDTRSIIPGAANAMRVVMPLARALDTQARLIALLLKLKVEVEPVHWDSLCLLGRYMRQSTFLDEVLIDPVGLLKPCTSRATFVYPILLKLANLPERSTNQILLIDKLTMRWAARVGIRIDTPPNLENQGHGPSVELSPDYSVRLDTTRLLKSLFERKQEWLADETGKRTAPFTRDELASLMDDLERLWSAEFRNNPGQPAPQRQIRLRFGLPRIYGQETSTGDATLTPAQAVAPGYVYGRLEQNTIMRMTFGAATKGRSSSELFMTEAESAHWLKVDGKRMVFERHVVTPSALLGSLVTMMAIPEALRRKSDDQEERASATPAPLILGQVIGVEQMTGQSKGLSMHRIVVNSFEAKTTPVGVRNDGNILFYDAFLLDRMPLSEAANSIVARRGLLRQGMHVTLRDQSSDRLAVLGDLMDEGRVFERFAVAIKG
jgi:hypothetical protein